MPFMTTACGVPLAVSAVSYGVDGASLIATGKSTTDHLISMTSEQDCALFRMLKGKAVCKEREDGIDPYDVDYSTPERMVSEDGVQFVPPLKPQPGAPATSWDAAAYKTAPVEKPKVEPVPLSANAETAAPATETTTVIAEPTPSPAAKAAKPRRAKKPKAKTRKPSPDRAESRS